MPLVTLPDIHKSFGSEIVLDGLGERFFAGEKVGLIGPNGCGKTTLFNLITGALRPDAGSVSFAGEELIGREPHEIARRGSWRKYQGPGIYPDLTVAENLTGAIGDSGDEAASRSDEWLALARLEEKRDLPAGLLSGGERNRLHLAKLLQQGANLLLLDEPTNDLDTETLRALEEALQNFPGCAVIISHDRRFLDRIATHILAFEGDSHVEWFEGNFEDYEQDKIRRLGADSVNPRRVTYKPLKR